MAIDFSSETALRGVGQSHYFVWYITPDQRGYHPPEMQAFFADLAPVITVELDGATYAALYDLRFAPLPPFLADPAQLIDVAPNVQLLVSTLPDGPIQTGSRMTTVLYFTGVPAAGENATIRLTLVGIDGRTIQAEPQMLSNESGQTIWSLRRRVDIPGD